MDPMTIETELPAVKVKALTWRGVVPIAESIVGTYSTSRINGKWKVMLSVSAHLHEATIARGEAPDFDMALVEAKAAAQQDYERRIMSALVFGGRDDA